MSIYNTKISYGSVSKLLHWTISIALIFMIVIGFYLKELSRFYTNIGMLHKSIGLILLAAMLVRFLWRCQNMSPVLPASVPRWQVRTSNFTHYVLYFLVFTMIFSGWVMSSAAGKAPNFFGMFLAPMPYIPLSTSLKIFGRNVHYYFGWILVALITLHILAAFKHHFINKDGVLRRMLPFGN